MSKDPDKTKHSLPISNKKNRIIQYQSTSNFKNIIRNRSYLSLWKPRDPAYEFQYPAYAVKSDDGDEKPKDQYPAYAVKSDDGKNQLNPIS